MFMVLVVGAEFVEDPSAVLGDGLGELVALEGWDGLSLLPQLGVRRAEVAVGADEAVGLPAGVFEIGGRPVVAASPLGGEEGGPPLLVAVRRLASAIILRSARRRRKPEHALLCE